MEYLDGKEFLRQFQENNVITGKFKIVPGNAYLMDLDFQGTIFRDAEIIGGDFASGIFKDCVFDHAVFIESAIVGVGFHNCHFIEGKFQRIQQSFGMDNCKIDHFTFW